MKDRGCNRCRRAVPEVVIGGMERKQANLSAYLHCIHCGTIWDISALALHGQAKADALSPPCPTASSLWPHH